MRILRTSAFFVVSVLVACGGGGKNNTPDAAPPDAPPDMGPPDMPPPDMPPPLDFSCENDPAATTAPDPVAASGTTSDVNISNMMLEPVADADVKAFKTGVNKDTQLGAVKTDAQGAWAFSLPTGATPLDGYVEASKTGQRTVRLYPPNPLAMDFTNAPLLLLAEGTFNLLLQFVLQDTQDAANGVVALLVVDCANQPVSGATISVKQGGNEVGKPHEVTQLSAGAFFVLDVPPGDTVVSATVGTHTLHAHTVVSVAGATTSTAVTPHP